MPKVFELRTYHAEPGRFEEMSARFRNGTVRLFAKHGLEVVGFWAPQENDNDGEETLIYLLSFDDRASADKAWTAFRADPEWISLRDKSEEHGPLVASIESVYLSPTDYSPMQ